MIDTTATIRWKSRSSRPHTVASQFPAKQSALGDPQPGMGHGTLTQRYEALGTGFGIPGTGVGSGQPIQCLQKYWPAALG